MDKLPKPYITKINNLKCVFVNFPCSYVVSAGFFVKIGSAYEPLELRGISHFLEHMLFKKNKFSPKMTNKLDELGISYNAATSRDNTYYECHGNTSQIKDIILLLFMIFTQPIFDERDVNKEREVIFEEMKGDKMSYRKTLFELTIKKIYNEKHNGYSLPIIGDVTTLNTINASSLKKFFDTYYHYDNAVLVIVGNIKYTEVEKYVTLLVNKYPRTGNITSDLILSNDVLSPSMIVNTINSASQTIMMVSFYIKNLTEQQKIQLFLLNHILTGNFMSLFFNELRVKRGLCYTVDSDNILIKINNTYNGLFFIKVDADPTKIKDCLKIILDVMITKKIKKSNFLASKKSINNIVSFSFQTSKDYLYFYGNMILNNDAITPSKIISTLEKTTLKDINDLMDVIRVGELFVNMIGAYTV
jgi:predicted Zn-dependent peptidase